MSGLLIKDEEETTVDNFWLRAGVLDLLNLPGFDDELAEHICGIPIACGSSSEEGPCGLELLEKWRV